MAGDTSGNKTRVREFEEQLVKAARMYAMCQKAGVAEPLDVTGMAVAAFEDMTLKQALVFLRSNQQYVGLEITSKIAMQRPSYGRLVEGV